MGRGSDCSLVIASLGFCRHVGDLAEARVSWLLSGPNLGGEPAGRRSRCLTLHFILFTWKKIKVIAWSRNWKGNLYESWNHQKLQEFRCQRDSPPEVSIVEQWWGCPLDASIWLPSRRDEVNLGALCLHLSNKIKNKIKFDLKKKTNPDITWIPKH